MIKISSRISSDAIASEKYNHYYQEYHALYPALKVHFEKLGSLV
jgi:hypothetical protein